MNDSYLIAGSNLKGIPMRALIEWFKAGIIIKHEPRNSRSLTWLNGTRYPISVDAYSACFPSLS